MVDIVRLRALVSRLHARCRRLERYARMIAEEYLANDEQIDASKYLLITAAEDALSIANHTIASDGYRAPSDFADAFRSLCEAGVLPPELAERLEDMARFRNLLVHEYAIVDNGRVHEFLRKDLKDLDSFALAILETFPELKSEQE